MSVHKNIIYIATKLHITIIFKRGWQCKDGSERLAPNQFEDPSPTIPTHGIKEENEKTVGDKKGASSEAN